MSTHHLEVTLTEDLQQLIHAAAAVSGRPINEFVIDAAAEASRRVLAGEPVTVLSDRDRDLFLELLEHPSEPNSTLRQAANRLWPAHD